MYFSQMNQRTQDELVHGSPVLVSAGVRQTLTWTKLFRITTVGKLPSWLITFKFGIEMVLNIYQNGFSILFQIQNPNSCFAER